MNKTRAITIQVIGFGLLLSCGQNRINGRGEFSQLRAGANAGPRDEQFKEILSGPEEKTQGCSGAATTTSLALASFSFEDVAGKDELFKEQKSLCDVLSASGKPVAIYQFRGEDCEACAKQIVNVAEAIKLSPYKDSIQHVIIISGSGDASARSKVRSELTTSTPAATIVEDEGTKGFDLFAKTPGNFESPTLVTMAMSEKGYIQNESVDTYLEIVPAAEALLKAEVPATPAGTSIFDVVSQAGWDGKNYLGSITMDIVVIR